MVALSEAGAAYPSLIHCVGLWEHAKIVFQGSADVKSSHSQLALTFALDAHIWKITDIFFKFEFALKELVIIAQSLESSVGMLGEPKAVSPHGECHVVASFLDDAFL